MRKPGRILRVFLLLAAAGTMLAGCDKGKPTDPFFDAKNIVVTSPQGNPGSDIDEISACVLAPYDFDSPYHYYYPYTSDYEPVRITTSPYKVSGFTLRFPETLPGNLLEKIEQNINYDWVLRIQVTSSEPDAKWAWVKIMGYKDGSRTQWRLYPRISEGMDFDAGQFSYVYVDRETTLNGRYYITSFENMKLRKGWNRIAELTREEIVDGFMVVNGVKTPVQTTSIHGWFSTDIPSSIYWVFESH